MCDEWMSQLQIRMNEEQFHKLPRHPAYRYYFYQDQAWITPQPRFHHALLDLESIESNPSITDKSPTVLLRQLEEADWSNLVLLFAQAFVHKEPFACLALDELQGAARKCLDQTRRGEDGPFLGTASIVAQIPGLISPVGACLITLLPQGDPRDPQNYYWNTIPEAKTGPIQKGRPHLTWIFVDPGLARHGIATQMLQKVGQILMGQGYCELASTFLLGNTESMLWHWRNQFRILSPP